MNNSSSSKPWTAQRVRDELPDIIVRGYDGREYPARIYGRLNQFASVVWKEASGAECELVWAWETIANAMNTDITLRVSLL